MTDQMATPETGALDAPASMESVLAEFAQDTAPEAETDEDQEQVEQAETGDAEQATEDSEETETADDETDESHDGTQEEAEEPTEADPQGRYTVKVNGEERKVTLDELKRGYSRTEDYTAKTMALAEERRTYQSTLSAEYENRLQTTTETFLRLDPILSEASKIDWQALAQEDPQTYTQLRAAYDARVNALGGVQAELQRVRQEREAQEAEDYEKGLVATEAALRGAKSFDDDAAFGKYVGDGVEALKSIGLPAEDLRGVLSNPDIAPSVFSLVHDALSFRAQQKAKANLPQKKVIPVSKAKALKSDAEGSRAPRKAPPASASLDARIDWAVKEMLEQGT